MSTLTITSQVVLSVAQLQHTSTNWDKKTKTILLYMAGAGNMFGGGGKGYCITLHGDNSTSPTGQIDVLGIFSESYNIARGANGGNSGTISYWIGIDDLTAIHSDNPTFRIDVTGSCNTGRDTLCAILSAEMDWLIN